MCCSSCTHSCMHTKHTHIGTHPKYPKYNLLEFLFKYKFTFLALALYIYQTSTDALNVFCHLWRELSTQLLFFAGCLIILLYISTSSLYPSQRILLLLSTPVNSTLSREIVMRDSAEKNHKEMTLLCTGLWLDYLSPLVSLPLATPPIL